MKSPIRYLAVSAVSVIALSILVAPVAARVSCPTSSQAAAIKTPLRYLETHASVATLNRALNCMGFLSSLPSSKSLSAVSVAALKKFYVVARVKLVPITKKNAVVFDAAAKSALVSGIARVAQPTAQPTGTSSAGPSPSPSATSAPYAYSLPQEYVQTFAGADWVQSPKLPPGFKVGHVITDYFSDTLQKTYVTPTLDSIKGSGAGWVAFDNYDTYLSVEPPLIAPKPQSAFHDYEMRAATDAELAAMIRDAHQKGLKFALLSELNFDGMTSGGYGVTQQIQDQAGKAQQRLQVLGDAFTNNPTPELAKYWDDWFKTYSEFIVHQADVAQANGVELLGIGKQLGAPTREEHLANWKALVSKVREHYKGQITYVTLGETSNEWSFADWSLVDVITITIGGNSWTTPDASSKSVPQLRDTLISVLNASYKPAATRYNKKVLLIEYFQSATTQEWFESGPPVSMHSYIVKDLLVQAKLSEALFQAVQNQSWVDGILTWSYWWKDDLTNQILPGDAAFDKSSNVRDKPAGEIFKRWSTGIGR